MHSLRDVHGIAVASNLPFTDDPRLVADEARQIEELGFVALWRSGVLPMIDVAVRATRHLPIATGIVSVSKVPAPEVIALYEALERDHPGRFTVGIGGAHDAHPLRTLDAYLDALDAAGIPVERRVLAALGPKMLGLARDRTAGAYPNLVTPEYVAAARERLGPDRFLTVLVMTAAIPDREVARTAALERLPLFTASGPYRDNLLRLGYSEADIDGLSDRLFDRLVAWGDGAAIAAHLAEFRAAGADQVVLRLLDVDGDLTAARDRVAAALFS